ncbi:MAG: SH3 domain-containing protein [Chroococcidiopsidaceae cyanobacterium CP_BM_RX_35]|nr:SH3 domain-containing protein [Chroococcidiopsidaceae cyanobacterium CP_BM_RX_35]
MKNLKFIAVQSATVSMLLGFGLSVAPAHGQGVPTDLANAAKEACVNSAKSKGFQVDQIVSVAPSGTDRANVGLNLSRDGHPFKLTCGYSKTAGAAIGNDSTATTTSASPATTTSASPDLRPLWWLLIPVIGLPLLLLWTRGRDRGRDSAVSTAVERYRGRDSGVRTAVERYRAVVRRSGSSVNIHSGPGDSYKVTGTLHDMQQVTLSGRQDNNWLELSEGGWVPAQYLETNPGYISQ